MKVDHLKAIPCHIPTCTGTSLDNPTCDVSLDITVQVGIERLFGDITKTAFHIPSEGQAPFSSAAGAAGAGAAGR